MLAHRTYRISMSARLMASVTIAALAAGPLAAQTANEVPLLGRIILGAGQPKVAMDTPQAVTLVEQEDLDRDQPETLTELFKTVPGVQGAGASARPLGQAFNIRGIGNSEQTASESRIIVTVDGAPKFFEQYRMGSFFGDLELFKRVEVLRGPASSTLYGSGAIGGAVAFTTKDASDFIPEDKTTTLRFKSAYDSNGNGSKQSLIFATKQGGAAYLGALNYSTGKDVKDGAGKVLPGTAHENVSGLLKGTWALGEEQSLTLSMSRTDSDLDDTVVAQTGGAAVAGFGTADVHTIDDTVALTWKNPVSDSTFWDVSAALSFTNTRVEKDNFSFGSMCAPGRSIVLCDSAYGYKTTSLRLENTADLSAGAWENFLTFGVQVSQQTRSASSIAGPLAFHPEGKDNKLGAYVQGEFVWNDRLTLIPGVRVDFGDVTPSAAAIAAGGAAQKDSAISPKLAVMYKVNDSWSVFGSVARTERMPTMDELYSSEAASSLPARTPSLNLAKESADTIELGFTYQRTGLFAADDRLQLKATAFHNDVTNMIATTPRVAGGAAVPYFSNIAAAKLWGVEVEADYDADRWFAQLAYSNVRSKDRSTGLTLADTPAENVALTLGAKLPDQNLTIGWRAAYFDKITTSSATTSGAAYDSHDVFVTWKPQDGVLAGLDLNLSLTNVFDADYRNNLSLDAAPGRSAKLSIGKSFSW
ncbi:TonB-dependent receptor domain-containing protein [Pseudorhodobacter sp.]|uniref:TonB-dependent receptor domain-containing protein n=1 Tax=Pseudorhodobacter sp. TaxID=1934400 RepID=UPI002AFE0C89|nr:TonB-dependent receptor [Pseudorhodobacter sp.]